MNDSIAQDEGWTSYDMSAAVDYENAMRAVRQPGPVRRGVLDAAELVRLSRAIGSKGEPLFTIELLTAAWRKG